MRPVEVLPVPCLHPADVNARCGQSLCGHLSEWIAADFRYETDFRPQHAQVMREDRRRASQRERHIARQVLAVQYQVFGQAVKNEIQVELTDDADFDHSNVPSVSCAGWGLESGVHTNILYPRKKTMWPPAFVCLRFITFTFVLLACQG